MDALELNVNKIYDFLVNKLNVNEIKDLMTTLAREEEHEELKEDSNELENEEKQDVIILKEVKEIQLGEER